MEVKEVARDIDQLGIRKKSNDEIKTELEQFKAGDFSAIPFGKIALRYKHIKPEEMARSATNAMSLIENDFGGDAIAGLKFLDDVKSTSLGKLDFNELVEKGSAHKLIELYHKAPEAFTKVSSAEYSNLQMLDEALDAASSLPTKAQDSDSSPPPTSQGPQAYNGHRQNIASLKVQKSIVTTSSALIAAESGAKDKTKSQNLGRKTVDNSAARRTFVPMA